MSEDETAAVVEVVKEMGLGAADFFRLLPRALAGMDYEIDGGGIEGGIDGARVETALQGRRLAIAAEPLADRRIAALVVERCRVTLAFHGWRAEDRLAFLARFDRAYHKGGG